MPVDELYLIVITTLFPPPSLWCQRMRVWCATERACIAVFCQCHIKTKNDQKSRLVWYLDSLLHSCLLYELMFGENTWLLNWDHFTSSSMQLSVQTTFYHSQLCYNGNTNTHHIRVRTLESWWRQEVMKWVPSLRVQTTVTYLTSSSRARIPSIYTQTHHTRHSGIWK